MPKPLFHVAHANEYNISYGSCQCRPRIVLYVRTSGLNGSLAVFVL